MIESDSFKAIFFDAAGTLFYLTKTVGDHYALVGEEVGLNLNAKRLDAAFYSAWAKMPAARGNRWSTRKRRQRLVARTD